MTVLHLLCRVFFNCMSGVGVLCSQLCMFFAS